MTWIAARRRYPRRQPSPSGRRRVGRPATKAHVVGVWAMSVCNGRLYPAWHVGRTLVCLAGPVSRRCAVLIEMDSTTARPDWQTLALKKRLRREGFRDVNLTDRIGVMKSLIRHNLPPRAKKEYIDPDRMSDCYN